jgi:hypothetical protein
MASGDSTDRAKFERSQRSTITKEALAFASGEEEAARHFLDLAMETYDALVTAGRPPTFAFDFHFNSPDVLMHVPTKADAVAPCEARRPGTLSTDLIAKWTSWRGEYEALMARQPRQALLQAMCLISSSHDSSSWPSGYEWQILKWLESGELTPLPFDDRCDIATPAFYAELRRLRQRARGWFYYAFGATPGEVFIPEDQLVAWCKEREAKDAEHQREVQDAKQRLNLWAQSKSKGSLPRTPQTKTFQTEGAVRQYIADQFKK